MKTSALVVLGAAALAAAQNFSTTSTVYATSVYTITSCAATVTDCPARLGQVTTDVVSLYETICPVTAAAGASSSAAPYVTSKPSGPSTIYQTVEYTILSCPPEVTNCPVGSKTYSVVPASTYVAAGAPAGSAAPYGSVIPPPSASKAPAGAAAPYVAPSSPSPAPVLSVETISTCVPTVIYSTITVTPATAVPYSTGAPAGVAAAAPKNATATYAVTAGASAQKAGGLLMLVGLAAALL